MWALRRASNPLRNRGIRLGGSQTGYPTVKVASHYLDDEAGLVEHTQCMSERFVLFKRGHHKQCDLLSSYISRHDFSSQAGMKSSGDEDDDLEDGFSELETPVSADETQAINTAESDDELISEPEGSDDDVEVLQNELGLSDTEPEVIKKKVEPKGNHIRLLKAIISAPGLSIKSVLDKWVDDGKEVSKSDIMVINLNLRRRRMYGRALQMLEWSENRYEWSERDYASRVDLIAKLHGLQKAEKYIDMIPKSYRGEVIYRTYLANCVVAVNVKKVEEVFNKMRDLNFPVTAFACNQLLLLYKRTDKKKIADVLLLMEKENVKPTIFTYNLLIDTKGLSHDINGMEKIVETMKAEGIEPVNHTRSILAKHYISGGITDKAEAVIKEMEGGDLRENRSACRSLLLLYSLLGKADEVSRIWNFCQSDANLYECLAAIDAWGKLHNVKEAEAVFEKSLKKWKRPSAKSFSTLLKVYADHSMLTEGKDLVKRMSESGCLIGPPVWDALVRLHVEAGQVEKADSILFKATQQNHVKPMFNSYMAIMEQYSKKGDVHNSEKMFLRMQQVGYTARLRQYQVLADAYLNAKKPAYGLRQRMMGDNIFPNRQMADKLEQVNPFKKTAASELLD